jgi:excisionase family DNA binding protein
VDLGGDVRLSLYEPDRWPELMSPAQVAQLMNIAPTTVGRWCEQGTIEAVKIGRVWRIPQHAVWPLVPPSLRVRWPDGPWKEQPERER